MIANAHRYCARPSCAAEAALVVARAIVARVDLTPKYG